MGTLTFGAAEPQTPEDLPDAAECAECAGSFDRLGSGAGVITATLFSKIHCSPKNEAENFPHFPHFPHAARWRSRRRLAPASPSITLRAV
jgi:hypothetical protein